MTLWMAVALLVLIAGMAFMTLWKPKDPWQADNLPSEGSSDQFRREGIIDADASHLLVPVPAAADSRPCFLVIDTETTGLPADETQFMVGADAPAPVSVGWQLLDFRFRCIEEVVCRLSTDEPVSPEAAALHGIADASLHGDDPHEVYARLLGAVSKAKVLSAHNLAFHRSVLVYDMRRRGLDPSPLFSLDDYCTMEAGVDFTHLYGSCGTWKLPRLTELFGALYFGLPGVRTTYREKVRNDIRLVAACLRRMNPTTPSLE